MSSFARPVGLVASLVIHAGVTAGLAFAGTSPTNAGVGVSPTVDVEIVPIEAPPSPPLPEPSRAGAASPPAAPARAAGASVRAATGHAETSRGEGAAASPVASAEAPLPRFTMALAPKAASSDASGASAAAAEGVRPAEVPVLPAAAAHVRAQLVASVPATYPFAARSDGIEAEVPLELVLDEAGRVLDARVVRAAGHGFDASALSAVRRYRFAPAERDGHAIRVRMPWTVQFRLN
jgi:periplasmic protein TonB